MNIFTKRNAVVGYVALRVLDRRLRMRSGSKLGLYIALGLISFGILAGVAAVAKRRHGGTAEGLEEDSATKDEAESDEAESEIVGEYVTPRPEPIPAT
ncbi:MAG: hypothetical protein ABI783_03475 [Actinomycetota bacterium]